MSGYRIINMKNPKERSEIIKEIEEALGENTEMWAEKMNDEEEIEMPVSYSLSPPSSLTIVRSIDEPYISISFIPSPNPRIGTYEVYVVRDAVEIFLYSTSSNQIQIQEPAADSNDQVVIRVYSRGYNGARSSSYASSSYSKLTVTPKNNLDHIIIGPGSSFKIQGTDGGRIRKRREEERIDESRRVEPKKRKISFDEDQ